MNKSKVTPKDFFMWAGAVVALYVVVFNYIALVWNYINYAYPDPLSYYPSDPYQSGISWEMATLIVLVPLFLVIMYFIRRDIKRDASRGEIWIRKWALYLTLFVAAITIAVDLIWVLYSFLSGMEITTSILLKALVVLMVAAIGFMHFLADLLGYWEKFPTRNRMVAMATGLLVVFTIVAGFFIVGTPGQARLYRLDTQKINDLTNIQYQIVNYWQQKEKLPVSLEDLIEPLRGSSDIPLDKQSGQPYTYVVTSNLTFKLCATFNAEGEYPRPGEASVMTRAMPVVPLPTGPIGKDSLGDLYNDTWQHGVGEVCFERTIDPERYPPYSQQDHM